MTDPIILYSWILKTWTLITSPANKKPFSISLLVIFLLILPHWNLPIKLNKFPYNFWSLRQLPPTPGNFRYLLLGKYEHFLEPNIADLYCYFVSHTAGRVTEGMGMSIPIATSAVLNSMSFLYLWILAKKSRHFWMYELYMH